MSSGVWGPTWDYEKNKMTIVYELGIPLVESVGSLGNFVKNTNQENVCRMSKTPTNMLWLRVNNVLNVLILQILLLDIVLIKST